MHETKHSFEKPLRTLLALSAFSGPLACGGATTDNALGSQTHFLARRSAECGGGL